MSSFRPLLSSPHSMMVAATTIQILIAFQVLSAPAASAQTREVTPFAVPSASPDRYMRAAAEFARQLDPTVEISYWGSETGALSRSRIEGGAVKCVLRVSAKISDALTPLNRFLSGRIDPRTQALFALSHEVGHCKLRNAFLKRVDGRAADASVLPSLAQEAAADAYGILSIERNLGEGVPIRHAVIVSRILAAAVFRDTAHATGRYVSEALRLCPYNRNDADAVQCAIATAYFTVGRISTDEQGALLALDSAPELVYELGMHRVAQTVKLYDDIAHFNAQFSGRDLSRFAFKEVSHHGDTRYIIAESRAQGDATHSLADYYGFRTGELITDDRRKLTAMRIDGDAELDWLLTLGAVILAEDGESLRKGAALR